MYYLNYLYRYATLFFIGLSCTHLFGQINEVDHWEMVVREGEEWNYYIPTSAIPVSWIEAAYDDSYWASGTTGIGYGDGDDQTLIDPAVSLYLRKKFELLDTSDIAYMTLYMDYDDAFVAYLNGREIARSNIAGDPPQFNTLAASLHEALLYRGITPEEFQIDHEFAKSVIKEGENILAIQVHNQDAGSSDLTAIPFLTVGLRGGGMTYQETPAWFVPPADYSLSTIPILSIHTYQQVIVDEPRINAWLSVIDHGEGIMNNLNDAPTGYDGWINIEIRGESAQLFPKKSYSFETQDSLGQNNNVSLLGLPEENDWILYGPYSDKTLIKNVLSYKLARDMGTYASRTRYCEVFINESYAGLYVLMEKIKQDKNRVDIATLREEDISGDQLTGGYILRIDKLDGNDYPSWTAYPEAEQSGENPVQYQYHDPDGWQLQPQQQDYIRNFMRDFEMALNGTFYLHDEKGYKPFVDIPSFVDYMILNEMTKNIDAYIYSTYLYKDRDSKGGKLHMGPVWDFNISFGNVDYNDQVAQTYGWVYNENYRIYWYRRMMNDPVFSDYLNCRWHELRSTVFRNDRIFGYIDSLVNELSDPIVKNFKKWPVLGSYVWPNIFIGNSYEEEIAQLKDWLARRLDWMDGSLSAECITALEEEDSGKMAVNVYPNPFDDYVRIETEGARQIRKIQLIDLKGRLIHNIYPGAESSSGSYVEITDSIFRVDQLRPGLYIASVEMADGTQEFLKIIKR